MACKTLSNLKMVRYCSRVFTNSMVALSLILLSSCGQSGPLYLPDQQQTAVGQEHTAST